MKKIITILFFLSFGFTFAQNKDYVLAENYFRNNEFEKAITLFEKLSNRSKHNTTYLERLVSCYQETNQYEKVNSLLENRLQSNPKMIFLNVLLGKNYERQKNTEKAQKYYQNAIKNIEKQPSYGTKVAEIFRNANKLDLAIQAYQKTGILKNTNYNIKIAQLYGEKGDFQNMFEAYFDFIDKNGANNVHNVKYQSSRYLTDDSENEINTLFKKSLLKRSANNPKREWNDLLAWIFAKEKEYGKALIQHKALFMRGNGSLHGIKQLGKIAFENKHYETAKSSFEFIQEKAKNPQEKFEAMSYILKIGVKTKEPTIDQQFNEAFETYGVNRNTLPIQLTYADYLTFDKNNPEKSREVLDKALQLSSSRYEKANIKLKLGDVLVYQNKFNKALIYFSQIQTQFPNHHLGQEARFKVAQTSYFKEDFKWAKAQTKVLKGSATQLIANDSAELFLIISDNQPKDSVPTGLAKFAKASLYAYQNRTADAIQLFNQITTEFKGQPIEDEAYFEQGKLYAKQGDFEKAIPAFKKVVLINKEGVLVDDSLYKLAELHHKQEKLEQAKNYYEKIVLDYPSSIYLVDARKKYRKLRGDKVSN